jgi:hypothetical protein
MHLLRPSPPRAYAGLRAMKMLGEADGPMGPAPRAMLDAAQRSLLQTSFVLEALPPISPGELGAAMDEPALARQFLQAMVAFSVAEGPPSARQSALLLAFSQVLGAMPGEVASLLAVAQHHSSIFRIHARRRPAGRTPRRAPLRHDAGGGHSSRVDALDPALAARYRALGSLPPRTLGRAYFCHCARNSLPFPGEPGGFPEAAAYHDFAHVLAGYATSAEGELLLAGFVAGFRRENPLFVALLAGFGLGAGLDTPQVQQLSAHHTIATPALAARFAIAVARGARLSTDLSVDWTPWDVVALPLGEARRRLDIEPEAPGLDSREAL